MGAANNIDQFRSDLTAAMIQVFSNEQNLPLLTEMYRTYQYSSQFPWNKESGQTVGSSPERTLVQFLSTFSYSFGTLSSPEKAMEVLPNTHNFPEEPTFERWLIQMRESVKPALVSSGRLKLVRSRFALAMRRETKNDRYNKDLLEQFILNGIHCYIGFWQNANDPGPW